MGKNYINGVVSTEFKLVIDTHLSDIDSMIKGIGSLLSTPFDLMLMRHYEKLGSQAEEKVLSVLAEGCHDEYEFLHMFVRTGNAKPKVNKTNISRIQKVTDKKVGKIRTVNSELIGEEYIKLADDIIFDITSTLMSERSKLIIITGEQTSGKSTLMNYVISKLDRDKFSIIDSYKLISSDIPMARANGDIPTLFFADNADISKTEPLARNTKHTMNTSPAVVFYVLNGSKAIGELTAGTNHSVYVTPKPAKDTIVGIVNSKRYSGKEIDTKSRYEVVSKIMLFCSDRVMHRINSVLHYLAYSRILTCDIEETETLKFDSQEINSAIHKFAGIKIFDKITKTENEIASNLKQKVIGQDIIIDKLAPLLSGLMAGVKEKDKPAGVLFLYGPSGVGKTELAKTIASELFEGRIYREDMNTFSERHSVSRIIGAPPGYIGHSETPPLLSFARINTRGVILFDEIEKADSVVCDHIMNLIDTGMIRDTTGEVYNLRDFLFIFTSNITYSLDSSSSVMGFSCTDVVPSKQDDVDKVLNSGYFKKEFIGRMNMVLRFDKLSTDSVRKIGEYFLDELSVTFENAGFHLGSLSHFLEPMMESYDDKIGIRSIKNYIQSSVKPKLMEKLYAE